MTKKSKEQKFREFCYKRQSFIQSDRPLEDFAKEITQNPLDPTLGSLKRWASATCEWNNGKSWQQQREEFKAGIEAITKAEPTPEAVGAIRTLESKGRYSEYLASTMLPAIEQSLADPWFHSIADEIALVDAYTKATLHQIKTIGAPDALWKELEGIQNDLVIANRQGNEKRVGELTEKLFRVIEKGDRQARLWEQVFASTDRRVQYTDIESKRIQRSESMIPADALVQFMILLKSKLYKAIIEDELTGQQLWNAIASACDQLIYQSGGG